jgi:hypothetical protein
MFLSVVVAHHLLNGPYIIGLSSLEMFEVQFFDKLRQGHSPGLLVGVGQDAELLRIQSQFPGHLDVGVGKMKMLSLIDSSLVLLWDHFLYHGSIIHGKLLYD